VLLTDEIVFALNQWRVAANCSSSAAHGSSVITIDFDVG
jgi:hypothetical protein